jgi:hypothetical protein
LYRKWREVIALYAEDGASVLKGEIEADESCCGEQRKSKQGRGVVERTY